jgi:triacylglycerol lipase
MATICAGRCKLSAIPANPQGLFTFGSPRVGNNRYINYVRIHHYRWVNNNDIVARVPPPWMGYRHGGHELYFNAFGRLRKYRSWRRFRDRVHGLVGALAKWEFDYLADHSMNRYVAHIKRAVDDEEAGRIKPVKKLPPTIG